MRPAPRRELKRLAGCGSAMRPSTSKTGFRSGIVEDRFRDDQFARIDAEDVGEQTVAAVSVTRNRPVESSSQPGRARSRSALDPPERHQKIRFGRRQQLVLGDRAGRHQPDDIAPDDRFCAALLGLRRVLDLLAHGDAVAEPDQLLQIVVGGMDRHAAHRNVAGPMLAALGQHDAERAGRHLRILEEQFVEIAHAIEQQRVRDSPP